ncbi:Protein of unknown function DUF2490 [Emticicia oligotrophica DSM 17448]|uniref:DUF2490 domain-containing protein n=1 Tax=Emticicia oligotrophica (strain DSM 17448 / CIP 109782 / MTCC 6937 / GPTSA100-15) TaxID=929562 RepID=A0ABN4AJ77_EMTOG|nr:MULTISPECIES: DUF2490 domain-containing protein [Emticicia]AFK02057.1 Protein of unknown function DUF2490 [Emticicia oligotrophica DSM 17448]
MFTRKVILTTLLLGLSLTVFAQKSVTDFQTWYDAAVKLNLKKGWKLSSRFRVRLNENSSNYRGSYLFLEGEKRVNKYIRVLANYRLAWVEGNQYHRFLIGTNAQFKTNGFTFFTRPMIQYQKEYFINDESSNNDSESFLRLRSGLRYKINKHWETYAYAEPFFKIKSGKPLSTSFWQNSVGLTYEYNKNKYATIYYIWQPEVNKKYPDTNQILGLSLEFEIKP